MLSAYFQDSEFRSKSVNNSWYWKKKIFRSAYTLYYIHIIWLFLCAARSRIHFYINATKWITRYQSTRAISVFHDNCTCTLWIHGFSIAIVDSSASFDVLAQLKYPKMSNALEITAFSLIINYLSDYWTTWMKIIPLNSMSTYKLYSYDIWHASVGSQFTNIWQIFHSWQQNVIPNKLISSSNLIHILLIQFKL